MVVQKSGGGAASASASSTAAITDRFHKIVLSWDYLRLIADAKDNKKAQELRPVKDRYESVAEYLGVFEPLLFDEVKAQIIKGRTNTNKAEEEEEEEEVTHDWQRGQVQSSVESEGFHKISIGVFDDFKENVGENDLLLLSKEKFEEGGTPTVYAFALVEQHERGNKLAISLRTFVAGEIENLNAAKPVTSQRLQRIASIFATTKSFLWILKICSLSTILREYSAMHYVASHPFKAVILSAAEKHKDGDDQSRAWNVPERFRFYFSFV